VVLCTMYSADGSVMLADYNSGMLIAIDVNNNQLFTVPIDDNIIDVGAVRVDSSLSYAYVNYAIDSSDPDTFGQYDLSTHKSLGPTAVSYSQTG
jgi:hypothetical protein